MNENFPEGIVMVPPTIYLTYKVYLITMDKRDQFWYSIDRGASDMAIISGFIQYIWDAPETKDTRQQIEILNKAVDNNANLILLAATDPIAISGAVEDAKSLGVKFIYVDSPAYEEAIITLSTDNYLAGVLAGRLMIDELRSKGIHNGSIGIIGVSLVTNSTLNREAGFRDVVVQGGNFRVLDTRYEEGDPLSSQEATEELINQNSDLVGVFATNEGSTIGAGNAIKSYGNRVIGIGFDISDEILALIEEGSLKGILTQNPYTMGYLGMAEAIAALKGFDTGPSMIDTGVSIITGKE